MKKNVEGGSRHDTRANPYSRLYLIRHWKAEWEFNILHNLNCEMIGFEIVVSFSFDSVIFLDGL